MLKYTDDLNAVAEAYRKGDVAPEDVHTHLAPRLEYVPGKETRRLMNNLELAVYTLAEPNRQTRILEILQEASRVADSYPAPPEGET